VNTPLLAGLYALGAAAVFGYFSLLARKGQAYANAASGVMIGLMVAVPMMGAGVAALWEPEWWNPEAIFYLTMAGLAGPATGRIFLYMSLHRLGVARAMPLNAMTPLVATTLAFFTIGERPGPYIWAGTVFIVAGSIALTYKKPSDTSWDRRHLWTAFANVFALSISLIFRKLALAIVSAPLFGAFVSSLSGLLFLFAFTPLLPVEDRPHFGVRKAWQFYGACGILNALAFILHFFSLNIGTVAVVSPLISTAPFFSLTLSLLFMRDVERVTRLIVIGTVLIVGGAALIGWRLN
jgi:drug/metabolite transporter (DMT)-like permease